VNNIINILIKIASSLILNVIFQMKKLKYKFCNRKFGFKIVKFNVSIYIYFLNKKTLMQICVFST
jgi:hypothetical protein